MELQWPLILFTTFICWAAGLFGMQAVLAFKGEGEKIQMPALIASVVLLAIGGIAVFFHLQHWERIFNGFGHITSGITQELIAIVVFVIVAVVFFIFLRRSENGGTVPSWVAVCAMIIAVVLVCVMGHSYNMAARPAWNSLLQIAVLLGEALALGAFSVEALQGWKEGDCKFAGMLALVMAIVNAVCTLAYGIAINASGSAVTQVGYYFDPTQATTPLTDSAAALNVFAGADAGLFWGGAIVVGVVVPLVLAFLARGKQAKTHMSYGAIALICTVIGAVCLRCVFYSAGISVFSLY